MFQTLTWKDYAIFLGGSLAVYYGYLALVYYRKELRQLLRRSERPGAPQWPPSIDNSQDKKRVWRVEEMPAETTGRTPDPSSNGQPLRHENWNNARSVLPEEPLPEQLLEDDSNEDDEPEPLPEMEALQTVAQYIRELFSQKESVPVQREELLKSIQSQLKAYPILQAQPYKIAINNLITSEAKEKYQLVIDEEELESLWRLRSE
jgi:hypothetical protein